MTKPLLISLCLSLACACSSDRPEPSAVAAPAEPPALVVEASRADLVFRYRDASGNVATASALGDIPDFAKKAVVVWDPSAPTPAGWDHVADLTKGLPATAKALHDFDFPPPAPEPTRTAQGDHEVVLFSTAGCGYCGKARKFFKSKSIPYTELDLETNPSASEKLSTMGRKAGLGPNDMQGVPIMFVDGKAIVGWDQARLSELLGLRS